MNTDAAAGVLRRVARVPTALSAAEALGKATVIDRRTEAALTSNVTSSAGTPSSEATLRTIASLTDGVKSLTDPEATTAVVSWCVVGGRDGGGGVRGLTRGGSDGGGGGSGTLGRVDGEGGDSSVGDGGGSVGVGDGCGWEGGGGEGDGGGGEGDGDGGEGGG